MAATSGLDKGWYTRFIFVLITSVWAWGAVWPSLQDYVPMPKWVSHYFQSKISPGLDIKGGLRLSYEVEVDEAIRDRRDALADQLEQQLGESLGILKKGELPGRPELDRVRQRVQIKRVADRQIEVRFADEKDASKLSRDLLKRLSELEEVTRNAGVVSLKLNPERLEDIRTTAVEQAVKTISDRIDELAIRETSVTSRGEEIIVEIPGADEATFNKIREIISRTARLEFKICDDDNDIVAGLNDLPEGVEKRTEQASAGAGRPAATTTYLFAKGKTASDAKRKLLAYIEKLEQAGRVPDDHQLIIGKVEAPVAAKQIEGKQATDWRTYYTFRRAEITGDYIEEAFVTFDNQENNKPKVALNFSSAGADIFAQLTERNVKRRMAIVLDGQIDSSPPVISEKIGGGRASITMGGYRSYKEIRDEAQALVVVLRAGALPAPIRPSNEQLIGPSLGRDSVKLGAMGAIIGTGLALLFMLFYYEVAGLVADIMVILNILFVLAILAFFEATLTLPGIAGMALTVGMALDANVLINERIREEMKAGRSAKAAVEQGYQRAFWSIFDSQLTTLIAGIVLFQYGTGPIKGFAVTLIIGIATSLFSGIFCSKVMMDWLVRGLGIQKLRVG